VNPITGTKSASLLGLSGSVVGDLIDWGAGLLETVSASPRGESEVLLGFVLGCSRSGLYLDLRRTVAADDRKRFEALAAQRAAGSPLQYLTGTQAFRKLELMVGPGVLVPRPETEMVVERCLELVRLIPAPIIVDVGTGSGAIALALATERGDCRVWATENSPAAMAWATRNFNRADARNAVVLAGDLLTPLPIDLKGKVDLVVSNPPYLSETDLALTPVDVRDHEPRGALVAGPTGLEVHEVLLQAAFDWLKPGGRLVVETFEGQWDALKAMLCQKYRSVGISPDLSGKLRIAEGCKP